MCIYIKDFYFVLWFLLFFFILESRTGWRSECTTGNYESSSVLFIIRYNFESCYRCRWFLVLRKWKEISITLNFVKIVAGIREDISLNSLSWWLIHKQMCLVMFFFCARVDWTPKKYKTFIDNQEYFFVCS